MTSSLPFGYMRDQLLENMSVTDEGAIADVAGPVEAWKKSNVLQHHSRAFGFLALGENDSGRDGGFFVPSYLEKSTYVQALRAAHQDKSRNESKPAAETEFHDNLDDFPSNPLPPGSHRGMAHAIVERPLPSSEESALSPLPTSWNKDDKWSGLEVWSDGRHIKLNGPRHQHERDQEASAIRADHFMPPQCGIYYYEVQIVSGKKDEYVGLSNTRCLRGDDT